VWVSGPEREERRAHVDTLIVALGEEGPAMRNIFGPVILRFGWSRCASVLDQAREIDAGDGIWAVTTRARRTLGGTFLALLKACEPEAESFLGRGRGDAKKLARRRAAARMPPPPDAARLAGVPGEHDLEGSVLGEATTAARCRRPLAGQAEQDMLAPMPTPGKLDVQIKINELPADVTTNKQGWKEFKLDCGGRLVSIALRPRMWNKIEEAAKQWPLWVAAINGGMGTSHGTGFIMSEPSVQVFERKSKPEPLPAVPEPPPEVA
jgi:hypothetical protein